jgi:hypothetical protein
MTTSRLSRILSALLLVAAMALSACSGSSAGDAVGDHGAPGGSADAQQGGQAGAVADPVDLIRGVSQAVDRAGSYRATFDMRATAQGQSIHMTGDGAFSNDPLQAHVDYAIEGLPGTGADTEMEVILDGSTMYLRAPALTQPMTLTTEWVSMDLNGLVPGFRDLAALGSGQNDPSSSIQYLRGIEDAHVVGQETVVGVETTHYAGTIDLERAYEDLPRDAGRELERAFAQVRRQFGGAHFPVDVWLDADGLPRRMDMAMETAPGAAVHFEMQIRIEIPEYGIEVRVQPPADHDVTDLTDLVPTS